MGGYDYKAASTNTWSEQNLCELDCLLLPRYNIYAQLLDTRNTSRGRNYRGPIYNWSLVETMGRVTSNIIAMLKVVI